MTLRQTAGSSGSADASGRRCGPSPALESRDQDSNHASKGLVRDAAHQRVDEGAMNREELQRTDLASLGQPTLCHLSIVQRNRIAASGNLRSHPADDEILAVDDEHEGGAAFDGGKVGE